MADDAAAHLSEEHRKSNNAPPQPPLQPAAMWAHSIPSVLLEALTAQHQELHGTPGTDEEKLQLLKSYLQGPTAESGASEQPSDAATNERYASRLWALSEQLTNEEAVFEA